MERLNTIRRELFERTIEIQAEGFELAAFYDKIIPRTSLQAPSKVIRIIPASTPIPTPYLDENTPAVKWFKKGEDDALRYSVENLSAVVYNKGDSIEVLVPELERMRTIPDSILELPVMFYLYQLGFHPLHASGGVMARNILFAGKSGCGKSSLIKLVIDSGGKMLADDRVYISQSDGKYFCRALQSEIYLRVEDSARTTPKTEIESRKTIGDRIIASFEPEVIVFPRFCKSEKPKLHSISSSEALMHLLPLTLPPKDKKDINFLAGFASYCESYILYLPAKRPMPQETGELLRRKFQF